MIKELPQNFLFKNLDNLIKIDNPLCVWYAIYYNNEHVEIPPCKGGYYRSKRAARGVLNKYIRLCVNKIARELERGPDDEYNSIKYYDDVYDLNYHLGWEQFKQDLIEEALELFDIREVERGF